MNLLHVNRAKYPLRLVCECPLGLLSSFCLRLQKPKYDACASFDNRVSIQRRHVIYDSKLATRRLLVLLDSDRSLIRLRVR